MPHVIERTRVFSTSWFDVIAKTTDLGDPRAPYYSLDMPDYVTVLATTVSGSVLLVRQYRPAVEQATLELPGGHVDQGETPAEAASRELLEETGHFAGDVELLGCLLPDSGRLSNRLWCYFARDVEPSPSPSALEPGIELVPCTKNELLNAIVASRFIHSMHVAVVLLAMLHNKLE